MAIRYKVVTNQRESVIAYKRLDELTLTYKKGTTVKAVEGSVGILCFEKRCQAEFFSSPGLATRAKSTQIIRVETIGRGKRIKWLLKLKYLNEFKEFTVKDIISGSVFSRNGYSVSMRAPVGTLAYKAVKVLD